MSLKVAKGISLRGYGDATPTAPDAVTHCKVYNDKGKKLGFLETYNVSVPNAMGHRWILKDGSLDVTFANPSDILTIHPVDSETVKAFPEAIPYLSDPNARLFIFSGNHYKDSAESISWKAKGELKCSNYVEVRCVFIVVLQNEVPQFKQCLGCHWFIGRK